MGGVESPRAEAAKMFSSRGTFYAATETKIQTSKPAYFPELEIEILRNRYKIESIHQRCGR